MIALLLRSALIVALSAGLLSAKSDDPGEFPLRNTYALNAAQRERLEQLVATDAEAATLFTTLQQDARAALEQEPAPLAVIAYEGLVNTDPRRIAAVAQLRQTDTVAALVNYWQASGDPRAAQAIRRFVVAWARVYQPTGNDVNENKLYPLFVGYHSLRTEFTAEERATIDAWLRDIGERHARGAVASRHLTNRFTKRIRLLALLGQTLAVPEWQEIANAGLKRFVREALRADGTSFDLEVRDSLTYHNSALRPVIELAILAGSDGRGLYTWTSPTGASLAKSVAFVVPYADGSQTRPEWLRTKVELDRRRGAEGIEAYRPGRLFEPRDALPLLEEASYFDASLVPLVLRLHGTDAKRFASWTMVLNEACRSEP